MQKLRWFFKEYLVPNIVIAALVGTLLSVIVRRDYFDYYALSAIYTFSISTITYITSHYFKHKLENYTPLYRTIGYLAIFLIGGVLGTFLGSAIAAFVFRFENFDFWRFTLYLVAFNIFITVVVGTVTSIYERSRSQRETAEQALQEKEIARQEMETLRTRAELKALQAQINPHFLFNTLNSIASLIPENPALAESVVEELSDYFRKTLTLSEEIEVALKDEVDLIRNYLDIEKIRFGDRLAYELDVLPELAEIKIPALIIQPLIENSIKYAVSKSSAETKISLKVRRINGILNIEVHDTGPGLPPEWQERGFGLKSIQSRLAYFYGEGAHFAAENQQGTRITLKIPL